jgi:lipopolysaccharide/colanic/teichoic acid biosynthesis glycosyltransferase
VPNDPRVTRVGRVIRALSIDELPQLINVLRDDMSLVGRDCNDSRRSPLLRRRRGVKPGITGWAQVNGLRGEVNTVETGRARRLRPLLHGVLHRASVNLV